MSVQILNNDDLVRLVMWDRLSRKMGRWTLFNMESVNMLKLQYLNRESMQLNHVKCSRTIRIANILFSKFPNCMVLAGGFLTSGYKSDADIWFYGITQEKVLEIIAYVKSDEFSGLKIDWKRNKNMLSFKFSPTIENEDMPYNGQSNLVEIQFILRIYPTKDRIIGDFDIGASAVLYDGRDTLFTALGAVCNLLRIVPVDISRYSNTYNFRLQKYQDIKRLMIIPLEIALAAAPNVVQKYHGISCYFALNYTKITLSTLEYENMVGSDYTLDAGSARKYIRHIFNKDSTKILENMHMKAESYDELFSEPYYFTEEYVNNMLIPNADMNISFFKMIYMYFGKVKGREYVGLLGDSRAGVIDEADNDILATMRLDKLNEIMKMHDEAIERFNTPFEISIINKNIPTKSDAQMTAAEWYKEHYVDIGLDKIPEQIVAIEASNMSDHIKEVLLESHYNIINTENIKYWNFIMSVS